MRICFLTGVQPLRFLSVDSVDKWVCDWFCFRGVSVSSSDCCDSSVSGEVAFDILVYRLSCAIINTSDPPL